MNGIVDDENKKKIVKLFVTKKLQKNKKIVQVVVDDIISETSDYKLIKYADGVKYYNSQLALDVYYKSNFYTMDEANNIFNILENNLEYYNPELTKVKIRGVYINIPRKQIAYGEAGLSYSFTGTNIKAINWNEPSIISEILLHMKNKLNALTGNNFNFVLINRYNDGKQHIGYHSDDERNLVDKPNIAGISFGGIRTVSFIKIDGEQKIDLDLEHGSLFIINNPTNQNWKHSILKTNQHASPRISLTFRQMKI